MCCRRCGLARPERYGLGWRCGCCGLLYVTEGVEGVVSAGSPKPMSAGSTPASPANTPDLPLSPTVERRLWGW